MDSFAKAPLPPLYGHYTSRYMKSWIQNGDKSSPELRAGQKVLSRPRGRGFAKRSCEEGKRKNAGRNGCLREGWSKNPSTKLVIRWSSHEPLSGIQSRLAFLPSPLIPPFYSVSFLRYAFRFLFPAGVPLTAAESFLLFVVPLAKIAIETCVYPL